MTENTITPKLKTMHGVLMSDEVEKYFNPSEANIARKGQECRKG